MKLSFLPGVAGTHRAALVVQTSNNAQFFNASGPWLYRRAGERRYHRLSECYLRQFIKAAVRSAALLSENEMEDPTLRFIILKLTRDIIQQMCWLSALTATRNWNRRRL